MTALRRTHRPDIAATHNNIGDLRPHSQAAPPLLVVSQILPCEATGRISPKPTATSETFDPTTKVLLYGSFRYYTH
ncbi:unnamed protein product [Lactuca virosa]|uniref:Uncharacterized protein n=1 Tax=Lactuca virosa TaxID=75947 RepID=A0AAU9PEL8_9ASTR|nr:unnamed protein product [Lactuca virosa]